MQVLPFSTMFIVCGAHITENLAHHKSSDVRRILEEKGFSDVGWHESEPAVHFFVRSADASNCKRTIIVFGDKDFVLANGVMLYDSPEAIKNSSRKQATA